MPLDMDLPQFALHRLPITTPPDIIVPYGAIATNTWVARVQAFGSQPKARVPSDTDASKGLEITMLRSARIGDAGNTWAVEVVTVGASPGNRVREDTGGAPYLEIDQRSNARLSILKGLIDAHPGYSSAYYGGETGTSVALKPAGRPYDRPAYPFQGGTPDVPYVTETVVVADALHYVGVSAPSKATGGRLMGVRTKEYDFIPPGHSLWLRSNATASRVGTVAAWLVRG